MKALQLGIYYGMGVRSLARGLDRHPLIASEVILRHKRSYPRSGSGAPTWCSGHAGARDRIRVRRLAAAPQHSPNKRTLYNFPMQSGGAEMLRLAARRLCEADLVPIMLVHDGILFELDNDEQVAQAIEIMRGAGTRVCDGLEIGVDIDQRLRQRALSRQPAGRREMWGVIMECCKRSARFRKPRRCERVEELQDHAGRDSGRANTGGARRDDQAAGGVR